MAKNIIQGELGQPIHIIALPVTSPTTDGPNGIPVSGAACAAGNIPGVAETGVDPVSLFTTLNTNCLAELAVLGQNGGGNVAVTAGDLLYIGATGVVSKIATGVKFGTAIGKATNPSLFTNTRTGTLVASGATTTILVWVGKIN